MMQEKTQVSGAKAVLAVAVVLVVITGVVFRQAWSASPEKRYPLRRPPRAKASAKAPRARTFVGSISMARR